MTKTLPTLLFVTTCLLHNFNGQQLVTIEGRVDENVQDDKMVSVRSTFQNLLAIIPQNQANVDGILGIDRVEKTVKTKFITWDKFATLKIQFNTIKYNVSVDQENRIDHFSQVEENDWETIICVPNLPQICIVCWEDDGYIGGDCAHCYHVVDEEIGPEPIDIDFESFKDDDESCGVFQLEDVVNHANALSDYDSLFAQSANVTLDSKNNILYVSMPIIEKTQSESVIDYRVDGSDGNLISLVFDQCRLNADLTPKQKDRSNQKILIV